MKASTPDLMKFKRLQRRLKVSTATLVGHLELLWLSTAKNAPEGDIGRFLNEDIAIACYWDGDPDEFVNSLIECGWLDVDPKWRLLVHDWQEHAPTYVHGFLKRHNRAFCSATLESGSSEPINDVGEPLEVASQSTKQPAKQVTKQLAIATSNMDGPTIPSQAKPKPSEAKTKPNQVKPSEGEGASASADASPPQVSPTELLNAWNSTMGQRCELTDKRTKAAKLRLKDPKWIERWRVALARCSESDFCRGVNDRGWVADFEWFIKPESVTRILEGKYDNRQPLFANTKAQSELSNTIAAGDSWLKRKQAELEAQNATL